jgi:hypothetical protein
MKQVGILFLFVLTACSVFAQSETRQIGKFNGIRVSEAIDLYLKKGDKESVKIEVEGVNLDDVVTDVVGGYLRVHMRHGNYSGKRIVRAYVTYTAIDRIQASSASSVFSEGVIKATLDIYCTKKQ